MPAVVEELTFSAAAHYEDTTFVFSEKMNAFIGGTGCGKSGLGQSERFAAGAPPPEAFAASALSHLRRVLGAGRVSMRARSADGLRFILERSLDQKAPIAKTPDGKLLDAKQVSELLDLEVYGPGEIPRMAKSVEQQLELLDRFAAADIRRVSKAIASVEGLLKENAGTLTRLAAEIAPRAALASELPGVNETLKGIAQPESADPVETARLLERKQKRGHEEQQLAALLHELGFVRAAFEGSDADIGRRLQASVDPALEHDANAEVFRAAHAEVDAVAREVHAVLGSLGGRVAAAERAVLALSQTLAGAHAAEETVYHEQVVRRDQDRERAAQREKLHAKVSALSAVQRELEEFERQHAAASEARKELLKERQRLYDERFAIRLAVARRITRKLAPFVKVKVRQGRGRKKYKALLTELLYRSNTQETTVDGIVDAIRPTALAEAARTGDLEPLMACDHMASGKAARAKKILDWLRDTGRLFELEIVALDDEPRIKLRIGDEHEFLYQLAKTSSDGQKCIAILAIILIREAGPLFIDEPELHLHGPLISTMLVHAFRAAKEVRQIFVVSHNACIVVLSFCERVFVLVPIGTRGRLKGFGTVDEMREDVEYMLDGGPEAFLIRAEQYGHLEVKKK